MGILSVLLSLAALSGSASPTAAQETPRRGSSAETKVKITVSKEIIYLVGPLRADGTVDYAAALNTQLGQGVTPENNAAIPLLRVIGPYFLVDASRAEVLRRLGMPSLPEKGNYWGGWEPAGDVETAKAVPWSERDYPAVAAWLNANERPLALVVEATNRPRFWIPLPEGEESWPLAVSSYTPVGGIARALVARAMGRLHSGDIAGAWADLRAGHRLARLIARHPTFNTWMVGVESDAYASGGVAALAKSRRITVGEAKAFLSDLRVLPPLPDVFEVLDRFERLKRLEIIVGFARASKGDREVWATLFDAPGLTGLSASDVDWDEALRTVNRWVDRLVAVRGKPSFAERRDALGALERELQDLKARARQTLRPENVRTLPRAARDPARARSTLGQAIGTLFDPDWSAAKLMSNAYWVEAQFRVNDTALALAGYRAEKGGFPARLEDLKPGYLPEIPKDPFVDRPLSYQRRGGAYLLYSVGRDGKPDKAAGAQSGDDIVVLAE